MIKKKNHRFFFFLLRNNLQKECFVSTLTVVFIQTLLKTLNPDYEK